MIRKKENLFWLRLVKLFNVFLLTIPIGAFWSLSYETNHLKNTLHDYRSWIIVLVFACLYIAFGKIYDAFLVSLNRISEMIYSQVLSFLITDALCFLIIFAIDGHLPSILLFALAMACQLLLSVAWCVFSHKWYFSVYPPRKTAVIYYHRVGMEDLISEYGLEKKFDVQVVMTADECVDNLGALDDMQAVFISGVPSHSRNIVLKYCIGRGIDVFVIPRVGDVIMSGARKRHMFHLPILSVKRYDPSFTYLLVKRVFDFVVALLGLVFLSPVFLVTAIAIKATDGGPVFYKQERLTKDGKKFNIHKFRSMRVDAEKDGVARLSSGEDDDRITPVGKVIRKLRIDELPQLIDILDGNLSVVGPRPEREEIALQYEDSIPEFRLRLQAKAGLTGYAQVYGKYNTTPYDKLQMDLMYIANPSIIEDLKICLATVKILFMPESTEGVDKSQVTAMESDEEKVIVGK